jgi:hypothetical protein
VKTCQPLTPAELRPGVEADVLALMRLGEVAMQPARRRPRELITACFDGSEGAGKMLETAADLAADPINFHSRCSWPRVRIRTPPIFENERKKCWPDTPGRTQYRSLAGDGLPELVQVLHEASALAMHRRSPLFSSTSLRQNLAQLGCPLFLVR